MKKMILGLVMMAAAAAPSFADRTAGPGYTGAENHHILVNGRLYQGTWTFVGDKPYVNVDSFGKLLEYPHQHNALAWQLSETAGPKGNPFQLQVDSGATKLPTVRFAGTTMVDLEKAAAALKLPYHYNFTAGRIEVGTPYHYEYVVGSFYRRLHRNGDLQGTSGDAWTNEDTRSFARPGNKLK